MTQEIQDFIATNRIGVLCVAMNNGAPHAATIHYSHSNEPLAFYVSTSAESKKCEPLDEGKSVKASFVIGFNESEMVTLQMDGEVSRVFNVQELENIHTIHYKKHPQAEAHKDNPNTAFLKFVPSWWRFSDFSGSKPRFVTE